MAIINPLDFHTIFVNTISGSIEIFLVFMLVMLVILGLKLRMGETAIGVGLCLLIVFLAQWMSWAFAFVVIVSAVVIFYSISKLIKL